jgi:hypothetical protein
MKVYYLLSINGEKELSEASEVWIWPYSQIIDSLILEHDKIRTNYWKWVKIQISKLSKNQNN